MIIGNEKNTKNLLSSRLVRPGLSQLVMASSVVASLFAVMAPLTSHCALGEEPKNILRFALTQEPPQLNPMKATDTQSGFVIGHIMEGLTRYRGQEISPGVAEKWEITDKGATFHLRKTAKWSDGKPVTAHDFIFGWKTALDPKTASEYAFILYPIKNGEAINQGKMQGSDLGAKAVDDYTIKVEFEKPCGYFLSLTCFDTYKPVREDFYKAHAEKFAADATEMLYNGPYVLTAWTHGASLRLDKNPNYWNKSVIQIDRIDIPYITPDNVAQFNFYKDHKVDVLERLGKDDLEKATKEGFKPKSFSDGSVFYLEFNFREGHPTTNKNLRKAIEMVFNPVEYTNKVVGIPGTKPGHTLVPQWVKGSKGLFDKEYPVPALKPNLVEAKKYLEAAKKELGGKIPSLSWLTQDTPLAAREAEYFQNLLKNTLGLDLKIDKQIFKQRLAKMTSGEFDIVSAGWGPDFPDAMTFAELKASWNENNRGKYKNDEYDKHIRAAQATGNPKVRMDNMAAALKLERDDVSIVPLYERQVMFLVHDNVDGVVRRAFSPDPDFTMAKLKK